MLEVLSNDNSRSSTLIGGDPEEELIGGGVDRCRKWAGVIGENAELAAWGIVTCPNGVGCRETGGEGGYPYCIKKESLFKKSLLAAIKSTRLTHLWHYERNRTLLLDVGWHIVYYDSLWLMLRLTNELLLTARRSYGRRERRSITVINVGICCHGILMCR